MTTDAVPGVADPAEGLAVPEPSAPNIVHIGENTVTLYPKVTLPLGIAAMTIARRTGRDVVLGATPFSDIDMAVIEGGLSEIYLRFGIKEWTFRDARGFPEPVNPENIERLLPYNGGGREVAEAADALYSDDVFRPFREATERYLQLTQPEPPTSAPSTNGSKPHGRSKRSSRIGSAGKPSEGRGRSPGKKRT